MSFLKGAGAALAAAASPSPVPSPASTPGKWDECDDNPVLPYDRPLEIKLQVLDGPDFDLMKYRGNPVMINIFATWCEPCTAEMPAVVEAANTYYAQGLRVIGLDHKEADNTVRAYRKRFSIPYPIAMDRDGGFVWALERAKRGQGIAFPVTLFITPDGYLYCFKIGSMAKPQLVYRIEKFLREAPTKT